MADVKRIKTVETTPDGRVIETFAMNDKQRAALGLPPQLTGDVTVVPSDLWSFIQLADVIVVSDSRGVEAYSDRRFAVGQPACSFGEKVSAITKHGDWFRVDVGSRAYFVPLTNVRSARR
jgi:hypothetical protein